MRRMLLTLSIGSYIHIETNSHSEDRRYTKTNTEPVVLVPAYGNFSGNIYYFWAVVGWSKEAVSGNVNTPQYTSEYTVPCGEKSLYVLTLDRGAYRPEDAYIAYRNAKGTVQVALMTPTQENCYDLTPSTLTDGSNKAIQEAGAILETLTTVRTSGIAPRVPGGRMKWDRDLYLYFNCFFQYGYGSGTIAEHSAVSIHIGDGHHPDFPGRDINLFWGSANVCGAGMVSLAQNDGGEVAKLTALTNIKDIFSGKVYPAGTEFTLPHNSVACFCLQ